MAPQKVNNLFVDYVPTECADCAIGLVGVPEVNMQGGWAGTISVRSLSGHTRDWDLSWRGRLRNAWMALRGKWDGHFEIDSPQTLERLKVALDGVAVQAWPKDSIWRSPRATR